MKLRLLPILMLISTVPAAADVRLPDVIGSSMVLQQKQAVPVWGKAGPGESVTVTFAGRKKTVVAGPDGNWRVDLGKFDANSTSQTMTITGENTIELKDILIGEVWLVSGQSNMQWRLPESTGGSEATATANHPNIRLFNVSREIAFKRKEGKLGEWAACTPDS